MNDVGYTCQITAGFRAVELQNHPEPIIVDHIAVHLAGHAHVTALQDWQQLVEAQGPGKSLRVPARNKLIDDLLLHTISDLATQDALQTVQVVNVGCGMDSKPWRLQLPISNVHWFDVDQPAVMQLKQQLLQQADAALNRQRSQEAAKQHRYPLLVNQWHPVAADLADTPLADCLKAAGFRPGCCTIWLAEALLYYLPLDSACKLLRHMHDLSGSSSKLIATCIDQELQLAHQGLTEDHYFATSKVQWHFDIDGLQHGTLEASGWKMDMQPRTTAELALEWYKRETYVALYGGAECCFTADLLNPV